MLLDDIRQAWNWTGLDPVRRWFGVIDYTDTGVFTLFSVG